MRIDTWISENRKFSDILGNCNSWETKKYVTMRSALAQTIFIDLFYLFIYLIFILLGGWLVRQLAGHLFSSSHGGVTSGKIHWYRAHWLRTMSWYVLTISSSDKAGHSGVQMRAWGLPEEFWVQERVQRSQAEKSWQPVRRHPLRVPSHHFAPRCECWFIAERPKLHPIIDAAHLQPIVNAANPSQDAHRQDWRNGNCE